MPKPLCIAVIFKADPYGNTYKLPWHLCSVFDIACHKVISTMFGPYPMKHDPLIPFEKYMERKNGNA